MGFLVRVKDRNLFLIEDDYRIARAFKDLGKRAEPTKYYWGSEAEAQVYDFFGDAENACNSAKNSFSHLANSLVVEKAAYTLKTHYTAGKPQ